MTQAHLLSAVVIGSAATALIDVWNLALKRLSDVRSLDYCWLGRWIGNLPTGVVRHRSMAAAKRVRFECPLGWAAHYSIGVALAIGFVAAAPEWIAHPTLGSALGFGIATVVFPFAILQPAFGLGIASSATARPAIARLKSVTTHVVFGVGLYAAAWVLSQFMLL